jgi:hypothetical protein
VVGDVELAVAPGHAGGRVHPLAAQHEALLGRAVAIAIAQQDDPVRRRCGGADPAHEQLHHETGDPTRPVARRCVGLRHQHVAIGQGQHRARVIESRGKARDRQTRGRLRPGVVGPAERLGQRDAGEPFGILLDQHRIGTRQLGDRMLGRASAHDPQRQSGNDDEHDRENDQHFAEHRFHGLEIGCGAPRGNTSALAGPSVIFAPKRDSAAIAFARALVRRVSRC